jgi:hypothetical protein
MHTDKTAKAVSRFVMPIVVARSGNWHSGGKGEGRASKRGRRRRRRKLSRFAFYAVTHHTPPIYPLFLTPLSFFPLCLSASNEMLAKVIKEK